MGEQVSPQGYESVYVIKMKLNWHQNCGALGAMWIVKERIVVFSEAGMLPEVFMDGHILISVS